MLFNTGAYLFGRWGAIPSRLQPRVYRFQSRKHKRQGTSRVRLFDQNLHL